MKKIYCLAIALALFPCASLLAQVSITRADFPEIGNLVVTAEDNTTQIDPGQAGPNQTWNFSNLVASSYDSVYYVSPAGLPGSQQYPGANIATNHNPLQYPNGYNINYWNFSDANLKGIADESLINLFGNLYFAFHVRYLPPSANLDFPIDYSDSKVQDFVMDWITATRVGGAVTDSARTISHIHLDCLADAHGTMVLPDGSFPVLRVKEVFQTVDSNFTWNGTAWVFNDTGSESWTQYRWYAQGVGEVGYFNPQSKKSSGSSFTFFKSESLVGMGEVPAAEVPAIVPNPAAARVKVVSGQPFDRIELLSMSGRVVLSSTDPVLDISSLPDGVYRVLAYRKGTCVRTTLVKQQGTY